VDAASLERHISFLLEAGVHGLFVLDPRARWPSSRTRSVTGVGGCRQDQRRASPGTGRRHRHDHEPVIDHAYEPSSAASTPSS